MKLAQVQKIALSLTGATEEPHFDKTSFRVRGRIFVTARPSDAHVNVFLSGESRDLALAMHPQHVEKLLWGGKVVGLRVQLSTPAGVMKDLIRSAWASKAPKALIAPRR